MKKNLKDSNDSLKEYSASLEEKVEERARDMKNLLENLGQGFMVFDKNGIVEPGCSNVTLDFFGMDPTSKNFSEVLQFKKEEQDSFESWRNNV